MQIKTPFEKPEPVQFSESDGGFTHTYSHDPKVYEAGEQQGVKKLKSMHGKRVKLLKGNAGPELQHVEFEGGHQDFVAHHELEKGVKHSYKQKQASQHAEALVNLGPLGKPGPTVAAPCSPPVQFREQEVEQFEERSGAEIIGEHGYKAHKHIMGLYEHPDGHSYQFGRGNWKHYHKSGLVTTHKDGLDHQAGIELLKSHVKGLHG